MLPHFSDSERAEALDRLETSGLRGRGGGWFPVHRKWRAVLAERGTPLIVANGGEGEPGSIKDRVAMRRLTAEIVEGLRIALQTLAAERAWIYLKASFDEEHRRLQAAIDDAGLAAEITIHRGDDSYVGGEETAILESIEGRRAWPRPKPPRPAAVGLFGRPTLVQNVDTLARLPGAVTGTRRPSESLAVTIWGDVARPGVYEVGADRTLSSVIENEGGGSLGVDTLVFPNGAHALPVVNAALKTSLSPEALAQKGTALGLASILVINDAESHLDVLRSIARFFERESCGQCPPCTLGTANLRGLIEGERPSTQRLTPHAAIRETTSFMSMHGYCGHSKAGALSVSNLFERWQDDVVRRLRESPAGSRPLRRDPFGVASPERAALEDFLKGL